MIVLIPLGNFFLGFTTRWLLIGNIILFSYHGYSYFNFEQWCGTGNFGTIEIVNQLFVNIESIVIMYLPNLFNLHTPLWFLIVIGRSIRKCRSGYNSTNFYDVFSYIKGIKNVWELWTQGLTKNLKTKACRSLYLRFFCATFRS